MVQRKLVKQGAATLMVSLPSKWCREKNLGKGSTVNLTKEGPNIMLSAEESKTHRTTAIAYTSDTETAVRSPLVNAYRRGYDQLDIKYTTKKQYEIIKEIVKTRLVGFEITQHEGNTIRIENITEPSEEKFETIFRKVFYNTKALLSSTKKRFAGEKVYEPYEEIEERINKYENFCRRLISKGKSEAKPEVFIFLTLVTHSQREIWHANRVFDELKKISPMTVDFINRIIELFEVLEKSYFDKDQKSLLRLHELDKKIFYVETYNLLSNSRGKETVLVYHLASCTRRLFQANSPLTALLIA